MRVHLWLVFVSICLGASTAAGAPPEPAIDDTLGGRDLTANMRVAVHVYSQAADFTPDDQRVSLDVAADVFARASVDVAWTMCGADTCLTPSAEALKLRLARSPDRGKTNSGVLGQALIDSQARAGVLATVFIDRTRKLARDLGIDYRVLLGRAIAHELTHLLLGTSVHGSGLMRDFWSRQQLLGTGRGDWALDPLDVAMIRERLARRGGIRARDAS
jgi:hypothetical protein